MKEFISLAVRFRKTHIVDEDFPKMRDAFDRELEHMQGTPNIVCLCGSTRFKKEFMEAQFRETMNGNIVLTVGGFPRHDNGDWNADMVTDKQKVALDLLHKRKIDLADELFIVNVGGYYGESTASEIAYAQSRGKPIRWLEEVTDDRTA